MTWFHDHRIAWIKERVEARGFLNRREIMEKFQISPVQASYDIRDAMKSWPDLMTYNASSKRYELKPPRPSS